MLQFVLLVIIEPNRLQLTSLKVLHNSDILAFLNLYLLIYICNQKEKNSMLFNQGEKTIKLQIVWELWEEEFLLSTKGFYMLQMEKIC